MTKASNYLKKKNDDRYEVRSESDRIFVIIKKKRGLKNNLLEQKRNFGKILTNGTVMIILLATLFRLM